MWLLVDDCRDLGADVIARNAKAAKKILAWNILHDDSNSPTFNFEGVMLDHDLGGAESGYDVALWALEHGYLPPKVEIVTSNPVGRGAFEVLLHRWGYEKVIVNCKERWEKK